MSKLVWCHIWANPGPSPQKGTPEYDITVILSGAGIQVPFAWKSDERKELLSHTDIGCDQGTCLTEELNTTSL